MDSSPASPAPIARPARLLLIAASLIPILLVLLYIVSYRLSLPYGDEWRIDALIAIDAAAGRLTPAELAQVDDGHRTVVTNTFIALTSALTHWTVQVESAINFIAILAQFVLLALLFRQSRRDRHRWPLALLAFSVLVFTVARQESWLSFRHSHYTFGALFLLLALWLTGQWPGRWPALVAALVSGVCATFSIASGMLVWPLVAVSLFLRGRVRWPQLAVWIVVAAVSVALYLYGSDIGFGAREAADNSRPLAVTNAALTLNDLGAKAHGVGVILTSFMLGENEADRAYDLLAAVGLIGFTLNLLIVRWRDGRWQPATNWIALAGYSLGTSALIALGRVSEGDTYVAFSSQYMTVGALFWVAFAALAIMNAARLVSQPSALPRLFAALDIAALIVLAGLTFSGDETGLRRAVDTWGHGLALQTQVTPAEQCVLDYRFTRDTDCMKLLQIRRNNYSVIDKMAAYRLALFSRLSPTLILPPSYQLGDAVMVSTETAWENLHVRDWLLPGVPDDNLYNVLPMAQIEDVAKLDSPRKMDNIAAMPGAIIPRVSGGIWLIYPPADEAATVGDLIKQLGEAGYSRRSTETLPLPVGLTVSEYRPSPPALSLRARGERYVGARFATF